MLPQGVAFCAGGADFENPPEYKMAASSRSSSMLVGIQKYHERVLFINKQTYQFCRKSPTMAPNVLITGVSGYMYVSPQVM